MRILLIQPLMTLRPMDSEFKRLMAPSMALMTLAALTPSQHEVFIVDENVEQINFDLPVDLVGITINVDTSQRAYQIAQSFHERGIPVVAGGIHASANPSEVSRYFDSLCVGDGEDIWPKMISDLEKGDLKTVYRAANEDAILRMPIPDRKKIKAESYLYTNTIITSKGCPHSCEFCYNSCEYVIHKTRNRPIDNVIEEIKGLKTKHIMFIDDNFIGNLAWVREFLRQIKPLNLYWNAAVSTNLFAHLELLDLMKESGCKSLFIGFESINENSIQSVHKRQNKVEQYEELIAEIHKRGIMVNASLVFGFDFDDKTVFRSTLDWLVRNKIETMTAHILTPYPGTVLYQRLLQENRIIDFNPQHYNTSHVVFAPKQMTPEELREGYLWMYKELYTFKNIIKRLPDSREQQIPYLLFNFLYRKFGKTVSSIGKLGFMRNFGKIARKLAYNI